jgi:prolyl 4-hydroxylase
MNIVLIVLALVAIAIILRPRYHHPRVYRQFVPPETCDYIVKQASEKLRPSTVSKEKIVDEKVRKSETAWLHSADPVVKHVMEACVSKTDRPLRNCEMLQVLKYTPGGFYTPHQDAFKNEKNMRRHTCIIALNDGYGGGETEFPTIGKKYRLNKGDMLFFDTTNDWGHMTPEALHGGTPVTSGEKWICNLWIRTYPHESS